MKFLHVLVKVCAALCRMYDCGYYIGVGWRGYEFYPTLSSRTSSSVRLRRSQSGQLSDDADADTVTRWRIAARYSTSPDLFALFDGNKGALISLASCCCCCLSVRRSLTSKSRKPFQLPYQYVFMWKYSERRANAAERRRQTRGISPLPFVYSKDTKSLCLTGPAFQILPNH